MKVELKRDYSWILARPEWQGIEVVFFELRSKGIYSSKRSYKLSKIIKLC